MAQLIGKVWPTIRQMADSWIRVVIQESNKLSRASGNNLQRAERIDNLVASCLRCSASQPAVGFLRRCQLDYFAIKQESERERVKIRDLASNGRTGEKSQRFLLICSPELKRYPRHQNRYQEFIATRRS